MFEAKLILASLAGGVPIYTLEARYWRAFHSEFMTHRVLNRNASSSRAIPVATMLKQVREQPAGPEHWGKNQKGMQAEQENNNPVRIPLYLMEAFAHFIVDTKVEGDYGNLFVSREVAWKFSAWLAAGMSEAFSDAEYHKQVANRLTEPYQYIRVVATATGPEWESVFKLRCHQDAMPEFYNLACGLRREIRNARPQLLKVGEWHIPYIKPDEQLLPTEVKLKMSAARCASTSYNTVEGKPMTMDVVERVYKQLVGDDPIHASPTEHQAQVGGFNSYVNEMRSPLRPPWLQYRKFIELQLPIDWAQRT